MKIVIDLDGFQKIVTVDKMPHEVRCPLHGIRPELTFTTEDEPLTMGTDYRVFVYSGATIKCLCCGTEMPVFTFAKNSIWDNRKGWKE